MYKITTKIASTILSSYFRLCMSVLMLALAAFGAGRAYSSDEFDRPFRSSRPPIVQEQRSSSRPPLQRYELIIKNRTRSESVITQVYARSINMRNWSVDLIPSYSISPGRQGLVNLYDGGESCEWRIKTVSDNGEAETSVNVCNTTSLTIY